MLVVKVEKEISLAIIEQLAVTFSGGLAVVDSSLTIIDCDAFLVDFHPLMCNPFVQYGV